MNEKKPNCQLTSRLMAITNNIKIHSPEETQKTHIGYNKERNRLQNEYGISKTTLHYVKKKTKLNKRKLYSV